MGRLSRPGPALVSAVLTSDRLRLDPLTSGHADLLVELDSDVEVLRHIFGRALTRDEVLDKWLPRRLSAGLGGLGFWVGTDLESGEFTGWWCLIPDAGARTAELGYRLPRSTWGRGLATEGAAAVLEHGFGPGRLTSVWATTRVTNEDSQRVLEKLGFNHTVTEGDVLRYELGSRT